MNSKTPHQDQKVKESLPPSDRQVNLLELHSLDEGHVVGLGME